MCVKSANAELFNRLLSKNLNKVENLVSYNIGVEKRYKDYVNDWIKSGVKKNSSTTTTSSTTNQSKPTTSSSIPKTSVQKNSSKFYSSEEKLMKDLQVVEDNVKMLNDIVYAASSPEEILNVIGSFFYNFFLG